MKRHLSTLSILHYVYGAFVCLLGVGLLSLVFLGHFLDSGWLAAHSQGEPPPPFVGSLLRGLGWALFLFVELHGVLNIVSASMIQRRTGHTFSQVVAALNCFNIPFGLALAIFTFITLNDAEAKQEYTQVRM